MITAASILLALACGFGAAVWVIVGIYNRRAGLWVRTIWTLILAADYLVCAVVIIGRLLNYFEELPRGVSILLLIPILAVPPAIHLAGWLKAMGIVQSDEALQAIRARRLKTRR